MDIRIERRGERNNSFLDSLLPIVVSGDFLSMSLARYWPYWLPHACSLYRITFGATSIANAESHPVRFRTQGNWSLIGFWSPRSAKFMRYVASDCYVNRVFSHGWLLVMFANNDALFSSSSSYEKSERTKKRKTRTGYASEKDRPTWLVFVWTWRKNASLIVVPALIKRRRFTRDWSREREW